MNIGIVTTWFERGAAYVSRIYEKLLEAEGHTVYIFARGGENIRSALNDKWSGKNVTRSNKYRDSSIEKKLMNKWIKKNRLEVIFFNEQRDFEIIIWLKKRYSSIKIGAYVDYYTETSIPKFKVYDFLICNTKRHMQAMKDHPQKFYVKWGTDVNLYKPVRQGHDLITFFHSVGMSPRKGTDVLIDAFIKGKLYEKSRLVIHTQIPIEKVTSYTTNDLLKYKNIEIVEKTVTAPGLYYMGDVYVYPTRLDGLGLTMYEALASGLPLITSDFPPMNEVGTDEIGKRVKIADYYCRGDAYYYPMVKCDMQSLIEAMRWYIENPKQLEEQKLMARAYAEENYDIKKRSKEVADIFTNAKLRPLDIKLEKEIKKSILKENVLVQKILNYRNVYEWMRK